MGFPMIISLGDYLKREFSYDTKANQSLKSRYQLVPIKSDFRSIGILSWICIDTVVIDPKKVFSAQMEDYVNFFRKDDRNLIPGCLRMITPYVAIKNLPFLN